MHMRPDNLNCPDHVVKAEDILAEGGRVLAEDVGLQLGIQPLEELPAGLKGGQLLTGRTCQPLLDPQHPQPSC